MPPKRIRDDDGAYRPYNYKRPRLLPGQTNPPLRRSRRHQASTSAPSPAQQVVTPAQHNATHSLLHGLPPPVRNILYDYLLENFFAEHRRWNIFRLRHGGLPPGYSRSHRARAIENGRYSLILTPISTLSNVPIAQLIAGIPIQYVFDPFTFHANNYVNMKRDLLTMVQVSTRFRQEYRTWQANRIVPYIRAEELDGWMRTFYPITDPSDPRSSQYNGVMPYIVLPWHTHRTWDALPMIEFALRNHRHLRPDGTMMGSPKIIARRLRYNGNTVESEHKHGDLMRRVLFHPGGDTTQSILSYIESGTGYQIHSVEVRYHGHPQPGKYRAMITIWFMDAPEVWWVDGRKWNWLHPDNTVPLPIDPYKPAEYRRKQEIRLFLESAGLQRSQIRHRWTIRLGVHGKHAVGGEGV